MTQEVIQHLDAPEWLNTPFSETLQDYDITAASTESDLDIAAIEIDADALDSNICLSGTREWLEAAHNKLISDAGTSNNGV